MATKIYNADEVSFTFSGVPCTSGWADGEFVKIEQNEDAFTIVVGTDGEVARSKTNNKTARVTLTLLQTSDYNKILATIHEADKATAGGTGVLPLLVKDNNGLATFAAKSAWIVKAADVTYDRGATSREWVFECGDLLRIAD
jgi:hypothetical protein